MSITKMTEGQRVTLSSIGIQSLRPAVQQVIMGKVAAAKDKYPDAVAVIMDGTNAPKHYHHSYWTPMN